MLKCMKSKHIISGVLWSIAITDIWLVYFHNTTIVKWQGLKIKKQVIMEATSWFLICVACLAVIAKKKNYDMDVTKSSKNKMRKTSQIWIAMYTS